MKSHVLKIFIWGINESASLMEEACKYSLETGNLFNLDVEIIGIGHKFQGHTHRIWLVQQYLAKLHPDTIVVCMDGSDTLFNNYEHAILNAFIEQNTKILISAERAYTYQYQEYRQKFDQITTSKYRYVNAGTLMGYVSDIKQMWLDLAELSKKYPTANDQGLLGIWLHDKLDEPELVKLDHNCDVFWVTTDEPKNLQHESLNSSGIFNIETGTKPSIIHCTGLGMNWVRDIYTKTAQSIAQNVKQKFLRIAILTPQPNELEDLHLSKKARQHDNPEPIWFKQRHPNIEAFFYGEGPDHLMNNIFTSYIEQAISQINAKYFFDYIVFVPRNHIIFYDEVWEYFNEIFDYQINQDLNGLESPHSLNFIFHKDRYFENPIVYKIDDAKLNREKLNIGNDKSITLKRSQIYHSTRDKELTPGSILSLGGWCGPAICLNQINVRKEALPFEMLHSTPEVLNEVLLENFREFYRQDIHIVTPHHNFKDPEGKATMDKRLLRFIDKLNRPEPILFLRVLISDDYKNSLKQLVNFINILGEKYKRFNDKLVIILKDQNVGTVKVKMLSPRIMIWASEGLVGWKVRNRKSTYDNYIKIIEYASDEENWVYDEPQLKVHQIKNVKTREVRKHLYDSPLDKFYKNLKGITLEDQLCELVAGFYYQQNKNKKRKTGFKKIRTGKERASISLLNLFFEDHSIEKFEMILFTSNYIKIDLDFPVFSYLKCSVDPREIFLFPSPFFNINTYRTLVHMHRKTRNNRWHDRTTEISYFQRNLEKESVKFLKNNGIHCIRNLAEDDGLEQALDSKFIIVEDGHQLLEDIPLLFLTKACIILLENKDHKFQCHYKSEFHNDLHFCLIELDNTDSSQSKIKKILERISTLDGELLSSLGYLKAKQIFSREYTLQYLDTELNNYAQYLNGKNIPFEFDTYKQTFPLSQFSQLYNQSRILF